MSTGIRTVVLFLVALLGNIASLKWLESTASCVLVVFGQRFLFKLAKAIVVDVKNMHAIRQMTSLNRLRVFTDYMVLLTDSLAF
jgi:hypothetical protein